MCGIAVLIGQEKSSNLAEHLFGMLNLIRHRGPDDEGWAAFSAEDFAVTIGGGLDTPASTYESKLPYAPRKDSVASPNSTVAIGHRRLAILDITPSGHQPMCYSDERFWIVFNGEIYNHDKLRETLRALGHQFISESDTEVILAAYAEWGEACLQRFEGMFAFVLVDRHFRKTFIARDRFGIKPLYYWVSPDRTLAFASEIKQFTMLPGWEAVLNGQRAYDFLAWSILDHTDETMFRGVYQLQPGCSVTLDIGHQLDIKSGERLETAQWYRLDGRLFNGTFEAASVEFRRRFKNAVRIHLRADVPVGSCLSGGLDSSSIVCMANELLRLQDVAGMQHAFSSCSSVKGFDEREYAEEVARHTGMIAHYIYPDLEELFERLDQIIWHQDEPFGSTSIFAQWSVFAAAGSNGIKVMLDGQGADEQLAGYPHYHGARFATLFRQYDWLELARDMQATSATHGHGLVWAVMWLADAILPSTMRRSLRTLMGVDKTTPAWLDMDRLGARAYDPMRDDFAKPLSIGELSYQQLTHTNLQMLLHWEDRDSMAHSVEARVPFLDHQLVEFVLGLPDSYKLHRGITKRVMREGLQGILPEAVRVRTSKLGFCTPEEYWIRNEAPAKFEAAVADAIKTTEGILRSEALEYTKNVIAGSNRFDFSIWRMISFARWMKQFNVKLA
jgi:asparagine synthase (glutamine-hydrolysing)